MSSTENPSSPLGSQSNATGTNAPPERRKKKRIRNWTADDRAAHRVFEKSRREAFKERLTTLSRLIPTLKSTDPNRLSKHVVIDESVALHKLEQQKIVQSLQQVDQLVAERDELLSELNSWRAGAGLEARQAGFVPDDHEGTSISASSRAPAPGGSDSTDGLPDNHRRHSGQAYVEEQASFITSDPVTAVDSILLPTAEPELPPGPVDVPWISPNLNFNLPNSLDIGPTFHNMVAVKSLDFMQLPMPFDVPANELRGETSRYDAGAMVPIVDPLSFPGNSFVYNG